MPDGNKRFSLKSQELKDKLRDFSNRKPFELKSNFNEMASKGLSTEQPNRKIQGVNTKELSKQVDDFAINLARAKDLTKKAKAFDTFKDTFTKGGLPSVPFSESVGRGPKNLQRKYPYLSSVYDLSAGPGEDPFIKRDISGRPVDNISGMTRYNDIAYAGLPASVIQEAEDDAKLAYDISQNAQGMIQEALAAGDFETAEKVLGQTLLNIAGTRKAVDKSGKEYDYVAKFNKEVPAYDWAEIVPYDIPTLKDMKGGRALNVKGQVSNPGRFAVEEMIRDIQNKYTEGKADYDEDLDLQAYRAVQRQKMRNAARRLNMNLDLNQSSFDERSGE